MNGSLRDLSWEDLGDYFSPLSCGARSVALEDKKGDCRPGGAEVLECSEIESPLGFEGDLRWFKNFLSEVLQGGHFEKGASTHFSCEAELSEL